MTNLTQPSLGERLNRTRPMRMTRTVSDETPGPAETLARGETSATPFLLLGSVAGLVFSAVAVLVAAALLIWWLV